MLPVLFRSLHAPAGGYTGASSSAGSRLIASPNTVAEGRPETTGSGVWKRKPLLTEKFASLRAAVPAAGSRRCLHSSSGSGRCHRPSPRSTVRLPCLRLMTRASPVVLCDEGRSETSSSFFSPFKFFERHRESSESDNGAAAAANGVSGDQPPLTGGLAAASMGPRAGDDSVAERLSALNSSRPRAGDTSSAAVPLRHEESSAFAGEGEAVHKRIKPPSIIPIPYEQFSREWTSVSGQDNFDGFRLEATKQVNKVLTANHTFHLGTATKEGGCSYSFGPTLVIGEPDESAQQEGEMPKFFGMARLSSEGSLQARFIKAISKTLDIKFNSNSSLAEGAKDKAMYEISLDKAGSDWTTNLKLAWQGTWIVNGLFSQVITPKLQMGGELTWVTTNGISMTSFGGRYAFDENNIGSCQIGVSPDFSSPLGFATDVYSGKAQYVRKVTDRLSVGTEIECTHPDMASSLKVGWQYLFRQARVQGTIDTAGRVAMYSQDYNGFALSGLIDYWHGDYKFGFQMNVVPPPPQPDH